MVALCCSCCSFARTSSFSGQDAPRPNGNVQLCTGAGASLIPRLIEPQTKELTMNDTRNAWRWRISCMTLAALLAGAALAQSPDAPPAGFENGPDMPHGGFPPP